MGSGSVADIGDVAAQMAAVDRGGFAKRSECRGFGGRFGEPHFGQSAAALFIFGRSGASAAGVLDSPGSAGNG